MDVVVFFANEYSNIMRFALIFGAQVPMKVENNVTRALVLIFLDVGDMDATLLWVVFLSSEILQNVS